MKLQVKQPPEKKRRKKNTMNSSASPPPPPSFSLLPDELMVNCLARIPVSYYPRLSTVSKSFMSLLSSAHLYAERSNLGVTEQCLYVCLEDTQQYPQWFKLWINPNQTMHECSMNNKKPTGQLLVSIPSSKFPCPFKSTIVVGPEIYVIGGCSGYINHKSINNKRSSAVQILDCRSHTWRDAPSMHVARKDATPCLYNGKIYVVGGGCKEDEPWAEVFDTKNQNWECLPDPDIEIRKYFIWGIAGMEGKVNIGAHDLSKTYAYDTKQGKWQCCDDKRTMWPTTDCMIENIRYGCGGSYIYNPIYCSWYDVNDRQWKYVKGLDSLGLKHIKNGGLSNMIKVEIFGGKVLLIWEEYMKHNKKVCCAQIAVEKRGTGEVWGNIEWVDVVHTIPRSCKVVHCLVVSV